MKPGAGISGIVLAAGESRRMGRPKQLLKICGEEVLGIVLKKASRLDLEELVLVLGHGAGEILRSLEIPGRVKVVINPDYPGGLSTSLRAGVRALERPVRGFMIFLGDQPFVRVSTMERILRAFLDADPAPLMAVPIYGGARGNPVVISSSLREEIGGLRGDVGARALMERHRKRILQVPVEDPGILVDLDRPQDVEEASRILGDLCSASSG